MKNDCVLLGSHFSKWRVKLMTTLKIKGLVLTKTPLMVAISLFMVLKCASNKTANE